MSARQCDHLRHLGRMMKEVAIPGNSGCRRPSRAVPHRIAEGEGAALRRLNPTEYSGSVWRHGPIGLQAARPGWISERGGGKRLAEGRKRQYGAEKDGLDLH